MCTKKNNSLKKHNPFKKSQNMKLTGFRNPLEVTEVLKISGSNKDL